MDIKTRKTEGGLYQLFIDDICVTNPYKTRTLAYKSYIENVTTQKGLVDFEEWEVNF